MRQNKKNGRTEILTVPSLYQEKRHRDRPERRNTVNKKKHKFLMKLAAGDSIYNDACTLDFLLYTSHLAENV